MSLLLLLGEYRLLLLHDLQVHLPTPPAQIGPEFLHWAEARKLGWNLQKLDFCRPGSPIFLAVSHSSLAACSFCWSCVWRPLSGCTCAPSLMSACLHADTTSLSELSRLTLIAISYWRANARLTLNGVRFAACTALTGIVSALH